MLRYPEFDPVAIDLGFLQIRWYGISYVVAILIAWWLLNRRAATIRRDWTSEQVADLIFYATVGLLLGGRLGSVLFYNLPYYVADPLAVLRIWEGGMSFHGGLLGGLIAVWIYGRSTGKPFVGVIDFLAPVVPIGLFSGRIGNFINGELWGTPSTLPWAMVFPDPRAGGIARHPSQLYEAFLEGVVLFVVLWTFSTRPRPAMAVSGLFLLLYGVFRSAVEFVREPEPMTDYLAWGWLTIGQVLSLPMILFGAGMLWWAYRRGPGTRGGG
jgi:phosphatidylglycerol:prolipoprotein diacylglycerol transferase